MRISLKLEKKLLIGVLIFTAVLYTIGMLKNGYANSFYAAAVQAGTHSWKAMFFGSIDASNYITVDKPPFALWVMESSTRIFGFHTWSMLLPNVLAGVATVGIVYASVRRWFSGSSALLAASVMALTPVAALMFGFDNPDAILTLLLAASMYAFLRAFEGKHAVRWLSLAGILTGCAFNTKMLQGFVLVPIFVLVYLYAAPVPIVRRLKNLLFSAIPLAIATLWWPVIVSVVPAANRPYIGSSDNNSIWNLIFGYNGFGRLLGKRAGHGGMMGGGAPTGGTGHALTGGFGGGLPTGGGFGGGRGPGGSGFGGSTGVFRMFNDSFGPNIAWFIPLCLCGIGLSIWLARKLPRVDRSRTAILAWGGYLLIHIVLFSIVSGTIHPYYPVAMAPAIAALVGITVPLLIAEYKRARNTALVLPLAITATGITACILLGYQTSFIPWLRWVVLIGALGSAVGLLIHLITPIKKLVTPLLLVGAVACAASPVGYSIDTVTVAHTGSIPTAGPSGTGMAGSNNETAKAETALISYLTKNRGNSKWLVAVASANESAAIQITSGQPVMAVGGFNGSDNALTVTQLKALVTSGKLRYYAVSSTGRGGGRGGNSAILNYITTNATKVDYGGAQYTLYDLK